MNSTLTTSDDGVIAGYSADSMLKLFSSDARDL